MQVIKRSFFSLLDSVNFNYVVRSNLKKKLKTINFNKKNQVAYLQDYLTWLDDGCNPLQAARGIATGYKSAEGERPVIQHQVSNSLITSLSNGGKIHEGLINWFDDDIIALFESGEDAGPKAIKLMLAEYIKQEAMISEVKSNLLKPITQPLIYFVVGFIMLSAYHMFMLPNFLEIMPLDKWDSIVQISNSIVNTFWEHFGLISSSSIAVVIYFIWYLANGVGSERDTLDKFYPFSFYRNIISMRLMKTIGILVILGDNPRRAVSRLLQVATKYERLFLQRMFDKLVTGEQEVQNFMNVGLLEDSVYQRLASIAAVESEDIKTAAISLAADRSGFEIQKSMASVTRWVVITAWLLVGAVMFMALISFVGIMDIQNAIS